MARRRQQLPARGRLTAGFLLTLVGLELWRAGTSLDQKLHEFGMVLGPVHYGYSVRESGRFRVDIGAAIDQKRGSLLLPVDPRSESGGGRAHRLGRCSSSLVREADAS